MLTRTCRSLAAAAVLASVPAFAEEAKPAAPPAAPAAKFEFEHYTLIVLKRAPDAPQISEAEKESLQAQHLAHLTKMGESGKAMVCGPFGDPRDQSLRGACIYRLPIEEARKFAESDPVVKAGRLTVEAVTWYVGKGYMAFPKAPAAGDAEAPK